MERLERLGIERLRLLGELTGTDQPNGQMGA